MICGLKDARDVYIRKKKTGKVVATVFGLAEYATV
jgi:hypothetical protein